MENKIGSAEVCSQNILSFIDLQSGDLLLTPLLLRSIKENTGRSFQAEQPDCISVQFWEEELNRAQAGGYLWLFPQMSFEKFFCKPWKVL